MPRQARKRSNTQIYHVMLRGINQQQIFEDNEDYAKFIQVIRDCKSLSGFQLFAYCLMGNHIHLLLKETNEPIEQIFRRIGSRYVYWYNVKYRRVGHLFQDRFKSEPIETNEYFLTVLRYIHQNPIKAGVCKKVEEYPYSSYGQFLEISDVIDSEFVFNIILQDDFIAYHNKFTNDICLDIEAASLVKMTDEQARKIIEKYSKCKSVADFQALSIPQRDKFLKIFKEKGLSIRQISRLTGVSFNIVRKF